MCNSSGFVLEVIHFVVGYIHKTGQEDMVTVMPAVGGVSCNSVQDNIACCEQVVVVVFLLAKVVDGCRAVLGESL